MSEVRHMPDVRVEYSATMIDTGSNLLVECAKIAPSLNHMIVWILNHQSEALALLPDFYRLRSACAEAVDDGVNEI